MTALGIDQFKLSAEELLYEGSSLKLKRNVFPKLCAVVWFWKILWGFGYFYTVLIQSIGSGNLLNKWITFYSFHYELSSSYKATPSPTSSKSF